MVSISPLKGFNKMVDSKILETLIYKPARENPVKFAGTMSLVSALSKDAVNCYYYTKQSYNNKRIPEERRGFVAAIDLVNGILNIGIQLTVGSWIAKKTPDWFEKFIGKNLDTKKTREVAKKTEDAVIKMNAATIKNELKNEAVSAIEIETYLKSKKIDGKITKQIAEKIESSITKLKVFEGLSASRIENYLNKKSVLGTLAKKGGKAGWLGIGFSAVTMLVGTQIVCKRMITPFLATPIASWVKDNYMDKPKDGKDAKPTDAIIEQAIAGPKYNNLLDKTSFSNFIKK